MIDKEKKRLKLQFSLNKGLKNFTYDYNGKIIKTKYIDFD